MSTSIKPKSRSKKPPVSHKKVHLPPPDSSNTSFPPVPSALIFRRGPVAHSILSLVTDLRLLFSPHSSQRLQERKSNTLKDFLAVAPQLQVTHFLCLTQSDVGVNLRVIRIPQGPTLTFRVTAYSLMRDVAKAQKRPHGVGKEFEHSPLVVLNNFSAPKGVEAPPATGDVTLHLPLVSTALQHLFPPLHLPTLVLSHCRRVVLFHFDPSTQLIDMRHYLITASPTNVSRVVRHLLKGKLSDMSQYTDVADYVKDMEGGGGGGASDSEGEVGEEAQVELSERFIGRGNARGVRSGVRLKELGPRLTLSLLKVEDDFCGGRVLYHHYLSKSKEEVEELKKRKEERRREREARRREQTKNVKRKRGEEGEEEDDWEGEEGEGEEAGEADVDDETWYEREVGEKPSKEIFGLDPKPLRHSREREEEEEVKVGKFKKRRMEARQAKEDAKAEEKESEEGVEGKKKRTGGRRVGAAPRKPWVRGRGGKFEEGQQGGGRGGGGDKGSSRGGRGGRGGGGGGRGGSRGRGGGRGGGRGTRGRGRG